MGRKQQRYVKLHSFLEDAVVSRGYQILESAIPAQTGQEIAKPRETERLDISAIVIPYATLRSFVAIYLIFWKTTKLFGMNR